MVSFRRHFVPNPVQFNYCNRSSPKRRRPLFIHTGYDADGNLVSETDALGNTTTYAYNALGLPAQQAVTLPNGGIQAALGPLYDKAGNMISNTDLMGDITSYTYNAQGDATQVTGPLQLPQNSPLITGAQSFSPTGAWNNGVCSDPSGQATYQFSGLVPGQQYTVLANWANSTWNVDDANYLFYYGTLTERRLAQPAGCAPGRPRLRGLSVPDPVHVHRHSRRRQQCADRALDRLYHGAACVGQRDASSRPPGRRPWLTTPTANC